MAALAGTADKLEKAAKVSNVNLDNLSVASFFLKSFSLPLHFLLAQVEGYDTKVPEEVRAANKDKLSQTRTEVERLTEAIKALRAI